MIDAIGRFMGSQRNRRVVCGSLVAAAVLLAVAFAVAGQYATAVGYGFSAVLSAFAFALNCLPE